MKVEINEWCELRNNVREGEPLTDGIVIKVYSGSKNNYEEVCVQLDELNAAIKQLEAEIR